MKTLSTLQQLPLGISTFSVIRNDGYLYVDKTKDIYNLITQGRRYFLSRPRRFGKSLLVSTLKEILSGNKSLFKDLWIEKSDYAWQPHGVIFLSFSGLGIKDADSLTSGLLRILSRIAQSYELTEPIHTTSPEFALDDLARALYNRFGKVAILIDEYDYPILKVLDDQKKAKEIRDSLQNFFSAIKDLDEYVSFTFITGVSAFAKAGIFSGLNNLTVITLNKQWATICGYTDQEIDHYFTPYIQAWINKKNIIKQNISYDELRQQIKYWYNGYQFGANVFSVYNPFSVMHAFNEQEYKNFWLGTGTPSFLIKEIKKNYRTVELEMLHLESFYATEDFLSAFEIGSTPLVSLLFQSGYLTIVRVDGEERVYTLDYPNYEVRTAMEQYFLSVFTQTDVNQAGLFVSELRTAFREKNISEIVALIKLTFARVPYPTHISEEKFYHGLLHVLFSAAGLKVYSEYMTSHARIDIIVELPSVNYVIELKFNQSAEKVLEQIENRKYYEALQYENKPIMLLGLNFHRKPKEFDITYASKEVIQKKK